MDSEIGVQSKIIIAGKSGMGKTTLIERIIFDNYRKFKYIAVFCPSKRFQTKDYECITNARFIQEDASAVNIAKYIHFQEHLARKFNRGELRDPPHALFILDDILDSSLRLYGKDKAQFVGLLSDCRHAYISIIFSVQTLHASIPPPIRDQVNALFLFYTGLDGKILKQIVNAPVKIGSRLMTVKDYELQVAELEGFPHTCIVYNSARRVYNKKLKITPAPPFRIEWNIEGLDSDEDSFF